MRAQIKLTGVIVNVSSSHDYDMRLTVITSERGRITVFAKGAKKPGSVFMGYSRPFIFAVFTVIETKDAYTLANVEVKEFFDELGNDIVIMSYAFYFAEFALYYCRENISAKETVDLMYVTFKALLNTNMDNVLVRRVFELRLMAINGEYPYVFKCRGCGKEKDLHYFSASKHAVYCDICAASEPTSDRVSVSTIFAMQYIIKEDIRKLYRFSLKKECLSELERCMDNYLSLNIDKRFKSLDVLYTINT